MDYTDLAEKICDDMLNYSVTNESFNEVYDIVFQKHGKEHLQDKSVILAKVVHFITVRGYDIECLKPLKFESYID